MAKIDGKIVHTLKGQEALNLVGNLSRTGASDIRDTMRRRHVELLECDVQDDAQIESLTDLHWELTLENRSEAATEFVTLPALQSFFRSEIAIRAIGRIKSVGKEQVDKKYPRFVELEAQRIREMTLRRGSFRNATEAFDALNTICRETVSMLGGEPRPTELLDRQHEFMDQMATVLEAQGRLQRTEWSPGRLAVFDNYLMTHRQKGGVWHVDSDALGPMNGLTILYRPFSLPTSVCLSSLHRDLLSPRQWISNGGRKGELRPEDWSFAAMTESDEEEDQ